MATAEARIPQKNRGSPKPLGIVILGIVITAQPARHNETHDAGRCQSCLSQIFMMVKNIPPCFFKGPQILSCQNEHYFLGRIPP